MITFDSTFEAAKTGCRQWAGQPSAADSGRKFENDPKEPVAIFWSTDRFTLEAAIH